MDTLEIRVWYKKRGQERPFTDAEYEATIKAVCQIGQHEAEIAEGWLKRIIRVLIHEFDEPPATALDPRLESLEKVGFGTWHVRIVDPFCD